MGARYKKLVFCRLDFSHYRDYSVEIWLGEELVGGLFGVSIGACFFGESMFSLRNDGSKLALVSIINRLNSCGHKLFDTQFFTPHLGSMGGIEISKIKYEKSD